MDYVKKIITRANLFLALSVSILVFIQSSPGSEEKVSRHLEYSGYSYATHESWKKESLYVTVKDGTKIAVDVFVPEEPTIDHAPEKMPTILVATPYGRSIIMEDMAWWEKLGAYAKYGTFGPVFDATTHAEVRQLLKKGYVFVQISMRGTGASTGSQLPTDPRIVDDTEEIIQWIRNQEWSDGNLCMMGRSYRAWIQLMVAARNPEGLKCIVPEAMAAETYTEFVNPGGINAIGWMKAYSRLLLGLNHGLNDPEALHVPATPVIDEDGDGELLDEIPLRAKGDPRSFLDDGSPTYSDGNDREDIYYNAVAEHKKNIPFLALPTRAPYQNSVDTIWKMKVTYARSNPISFAKDLAQSNVAVYHFGGWFDGALNGASLMYATMEEHGAKNMKLHIAPRFHYSPYMTNAYRKYLEYDGIYTDQAATERLRFFDYHLKGIENGIHNEPPVHIYTMHKGWKQSGIWPPKNAETLSMHLSSNGGLISDREDKLSSTGSSSRNYDIDFSHNSSYGSNKINRWLMMYLPDEVMWRTEKDTKTLVYETPPLDSSLEVTGHPIVRLFISANQDDADVFTYLTDVHPDGRSHYVSEGQLRAGWFPMMENDAMVNGKFTVKPDLPFHGYRKGEYVDSPLADGAVRKLEFALFPISYQFRKGHRIRISIAGADAGNFEFHPSLCSGTEPETCKPTTLSIHHGKNRGSLLQLPVVLENKRNQR